MSLFVYMLAPLGGTVLVLIFMRMLLEHRMKWWQIPVTALVMELTMIPRILFGVDSLPSVAANLICMAAGLFLIPLAFFLGVWWKRILLSVYLWTVLMLCDLMCSSYFIPIHGLDFTQWPLDELASYVTICLLLYVMLGSVSVLVLRQVAARQSGTAEPWIRLGAKAEGDYLFIRTTNPAVAPPEQPLPGHGCGTRILTGLAARHDGAYQTRFENGVHTALLSLMVRQ